MVKCLLSSYAHFFLILTQDIQAQITYLKQYFQARITNPPLEKSNCLGKIIVDPLSL
jgi:hypothetical protein